MLQKEHKVMKIGFVGIGKLGKPVATVMALKDHDVMCYDVNPNNMNKEFTEIEADDNGNPNGFKDMLAKADLKFGSLQDVITHGEIIFTAIQTPHAEQYGGHVRVPKDAVDFDYSYLIDCIKNINACEINEPKVVVIISTVLPTTIREKILPLITNPNIKIVYNPYFIAMSTVVPDFLHPEFVLIGVDDPMAAAKLCDFYDTLYSEPSDMCWSGDLTLIDKKTTYACMTIEEAELVKVAYNFFISSKINYANFLMEICHKLKNMNVDVITNTLAKATKRIISNKYMTGGLGDGGNCFLPNQLVFTAEGPKPIKDIKFGELVLTENGKLEMVMNTYCRHYKGKIIKLRGKGLQPCYLTPEHTVYVSKDLRSKYKTTSKGKAVVKYDNKKPLPENTSAMLAVEAEKLTKDYYLLFPNPQTHCNSADYIDLDINSIYAYIELAGYYLSEGSVDGRRGKAPNRTAFSMGTHEQEDLRRISDLIEILGGNPTRNKSKTSKGESVRVSNKYLTNQLVNDFGKLAATKRIPAWLVFGDLNLCTLLIKSMWRGDGSSHSEGFSYSTISPNLAYGIHLILKRLGIPSTLNEHKAHVGKDGTPHRISFDVKVSNAAYIGKLAEITEKDIKHKMQEKRYSNSIFEKGGYYYHHVTEIKELDYEGNVHNLNVGTSHKYVTNAGLVANCHPRDAIAMRYLSQKIGMDYDFSGMIMQTREKQTEWLANLIKEQSEKTKLPIVILGKAFKENMALTGGSPAILLSNLLQEAAIPHTHYDPLVDKDKSFKLIPAVYFIATKHNIFKNYLFPEGCVILDPFRYLKHLAHCPKLTYIPIGDSTNENP